MEGEKALSLVEIEKQKDPELENFLNEEFVETNKNDNTTEKEYLELKKE